MPPSLTVAVPTYKRPDLLERALASVTAAGPAVAHDTELVVSDNSEDDRSRAVYDRIVAGWSGPTQYVQNPPGTGMVGNFNRCAELASGRYILILHDDDYLLEGGVECIHEAIRQAGDDERPMLFGVRVVDQEGQLLRRQQPRRAQAVPASVMLRRFLQHSSLVRFPAMVVPAALYRAVGPFDAEVGGLTDIDMWSRLFARYGARLVPATCAAYVVHPAAATERTWTPEAVRSALTIFQRRAADGVLPADELARCRRTWLHQFILAGAVRRLRARDRAGACRVMALFELPEVSRLGWSMRWAPVRAAMTLFTLDGRS